MIGKNNSYLYEVKKGTKVETYSIKKFKIGAASVVIGASIFFGAGSVAQAGEISLNNALKTIEVTQGSLDVPKVYNKPILENTKESVASAVASKVGTKISETKVTNEEKSKVETVKKEILKASIVTLEEKLKSAQDTDKIVIETAKEVIAAAKVVVTNEKATQSEIDIQVQKIQDLSIVVTEAKVKAFDKKLEEKKEAEQRDKEVTATKKEKEVAKVKKELTQVASEAEVTNTLAKIELNKKDLKVEAKPAVQAVVVKNEEAIKLAKELLGNDKATKEQIANSLAELSNSIKAVYTQLEKAGVKRSGKFDVSLTETEVEPLQDASTEIGKKWLADHGYTSLTDIPIKTKERNGAEIKNLNGQIQWLDFGDKKAWTKLKENGQLQVGSAFEKEIIPGYTVKLTVKELKPFDATDVYKRRVAGTVYQNSYKPDGENRVDANNGKPTVTGIGGVPQGYWSETKNSGLDTGKAKTTIGGVGADGVGRDATVAGVKFTIEAKYNGKLIKPSIVMTSGEQIGDKETEIYTTNGTPWDLLALIGHGQAKHYLPLNKFNTLFDPRSMKRLGDQAFVDALAAGKFATPDSATAGLGSQVFGGYTNMDGRATPIVSSNNVTEVGFYLLTTGQQSSMLGIKISDYGDLPESYGKVEHYLKTKTLDSVTGAEKQIQQPYLGTVKADPESNPGRNISGENSDDETDHADEGVDQLMPSDFIVRNKETGLSAIRPILGPNNTHKIKIKASANGNENFNGPLEKAYVRGFIDFNNNGKFDQGEESDIKEVTGNNQIVELTFHNTHVIDENNDIIKFRVRIATDRTQVENPTGIAYSGEVEDNQVQVTNPPRGDYEETTGKQGDKQRISFEYISHNKGDEPGDLGSKNGSVTFNSYGKIDYTQERNSITAETTKTAQGGVRIVNETGQLVTNLNVPGQGTYEVSDTGVTFTPDPAFVGKASGVVLRAVDANGQSTGWEAVTDGDVLTNTNNGGHSAGNNKSMDAVYVPIVEPKEMTGHSKETTGLQGKEQKGIPLFKVNAGREAERIVSPSTQYIAKLVDPKSGSIINETSITVENEGTYTIVPETGEVKFQPLLSFKGTAGGVTVELTGPVGFDKDGVPSLSTARAKYIPTVIAVSPTAEAATSTGIQGEVQTGKPIFKKGHEEVPIKENSIKLLNSDGDEVTETPALGEGNKEVGKYTVDSSTGIVTFTPTDKSYIGTVVPARVQAKDINETKVETKYTPSIVGVKPQASPATSTGIQGEIQEGTVTFTAGKAVIGDVEKSVPIKVGSSKLIGSDGTEVTEVPAYANDGVKQVGTYSITPGINKVIFTPTDKTYTGTVLPVDVQAEDENGTKVRTTYTPHILGVSPTAKPAVSKDIQGKEQTKEVLFKPGKTTIDGVDKEVPLDSSTFKLLDENGQERDSVPAKSSDGLKEIGTYRIKVVDNKPVVVFTPSDKTYTGEVREVTIQVKDTNGSKVTTTYTPTIVPVRPISTPVRSIGVQGLPQEGTPIFTAGKAMLNGKEVEVPLSTKAPKLVNPETGLPTDEKAIKVPNEGTYTIDENGKVTFTPEPQFTGVANGVEVQREDQNGTSVNAKYTPTVKGVTPTSKDVTSIGDKGEKQFGTPVFKAGSTTINNEKVEVPIDENVAPRLEGADEEGKVVIPKEGIYTIDATGKVTFTPENDFVGVATGVTVKRVDKNGTLVTATYTPTVLGKTTTENVISEGAKNQPQSNTPLFKGDIDTTVPPTFEDKTKEKVISGQGTYTINDEGVVTFIPEKDYVGTATAVEVVRRDKNGRTIKATYTPTVRPETKYVTVENNGKETELIPTKDGKYPEEKIERYRVIKTETDEKGNTKHIYEKVNTFFKDKEGNEIPKYPSEPGTVDKKDIPEYRFVESKKLPNGDTEHVYEKIKLPRIIARDKEGNIIPGFEYDMLSPILEIPEYRYTGEEKLPDGTIKRIYEPILTIHKDKQGNPIPNVPEIEKGIKRSRNIPGYRLVKTKTLPNGDIEYVYEKNSISVVEKITKWTDDNGNLLKPSEKGLVNSGEIEGYEFVRTIVDEVGNIQHIFKKKSRIPESSRITIWTDEDGNELRLSEKGTRGIGMIEGYEFVRTVVEENGNLRHIFKKVSVTAKKVQIKRLANTGTETTNVVGLGVLLAGIATVIKKRRKKY